MSEARISLTARYDISPDAYESTAERILHMGGVIVEAVSHLPETTMPTPHLVDEASFRQIAGKHGLTANHITRAWNAGRRISHQNADKPDADVHGKNSGCVNLAVVSDLIRKIEVGNQNFSHGLGATYWNVYANLINIRLVTAETPDAIVLPWQADIHPHLLRANYEASHYAAARLAAAYRQLREAQSTQQYQLF